MDGYKTYSIIADFNLYCNFTLSHGGGVNKTFAGYIDWTDAYASFSAAYHRYVDIVVCRLIF